MKTDGYTKAVLSVIAICLVAIVLRDLGVVPTAQAAIDRGEQVVKVQIVSIDEAPHLAWESIPVRMER